MTMNAFNLFLGIMSLIALIVFIALYFVKAGYGIFRTASWGVAISNKLAWILIFPACIRFSSIADRKE